MRDEDGELVSPDQFIPAAERYNLMSTLDRWVIHEALSKLADRSEDGEAKFTLAINLSGTSLSEDRFLDYVISELEAQKLPKGAICFEITDSPTSRTCRSTISRSMAISSVMSLRTMSMRAWLRQLPRSAARWVSRLSLNVSRRGRYWTSWPHLALSMRRAITSPGLPRSSLSSPGAKTPIPGSCRGRGVA
jgi:predicted signal transduction protein with EAL and GGDEF domain